MIIHIDDHEVSKLHVNAAGLLEQESTQPFSCFPLVLKPRLVDFTVLPVLACWAFSEASVQALLTGRLIFLSTYEIKASINIAVKRSRPLMPEEYPRPL